MGFWNTFVRGRRCHPMYHFNPRAQLALAVARKEADRRGHRDIEPEHLLFALLRLDHGEAWNVLRLLNVAPATLRVALEKVFAATPSATRSHLPSLSYSAAAKQSLAFAGQEAEALGHRHVGTDHFLLGLLRAGGSTENVLTAAGVRLDRARAAVIATHEMDDANEFSVRRPGL